MGRTSAQSCAALTRPGSTEPEAGPCLNKTVDGVFPMSRLVLALALLTTCSLMLTGCQFFSSQRTVQLEPDIIEEYHALRDVYVKAKMPALTPAPQFIDAGSDTVQLANFYAGKYAESVTAICASADLIAFQAEMLNSTIEPDVDAFPELTKIQCKMARDVLAIQLQLLSQLGR